MRATPAVQKTNSLAIHASSGNLGAGDGCVEPPGAGAHTIAQVCWVSRGIKNHLGPLPGGQQLLAPILQVYDIAIGGHAGPMPGESILGEVVPRDH